MGLRASSRRSITAAIFALTIASDATKVGAQASEAPDEEVRGDRDAPLRLRARAELGAFGVLRHRIRYGAAGTDVNYRRDADQDTLFPFARLSAELWIRRRHALVFVYQPLTIRTESVIDRDLQLGDVVFPEGTLTRFVYGFDFYRLSYQYDFFADDRHELALGAGIQLRNARILFAASDGELGFAQTNLGPVPTLRARGGYVFARGAFLEAEVEGIYIPVPGEAEGAQARGALLDAALRAGFRATRRFEAFLTVRYLGGGYRGPASGVPGLDDDEATSNWLHTLIVSLGAGFR